MRKAFRWFYEQVDRPGTPLLAETVEGARFAPSLDEAREKLQRLRKFDLDFLTHTGKDYVLGLDEVGRGPLAGPLVACCVRFPSPLPSLLFLRDSKKLSAGEREVLAARIERVALAVGYGVVEAEEFGGTLNLHHLTFEAMRRAVVMVDPGALSQSGEGPAPAGALLVDGKFRLPHWTGIQRAVVKGDDQSLSIAAASVLAKVYRDRRMAELDREFPHYGFARHVGYGTAAHRRAILLHGPCAHHRTNFLSRLLSPDKV